MCDLLNSYPPILFLYKHTTLYSTYYGSQMSHNISHPRMFYLIHEIDFWFWLLLLFFFLFFLFSTMHYWHLWRIYACITIEKQVHRSLVRLLQGKVDFSWSSRSFRHLVYDENQNNQCKRHLSYMSLCSSCFCWSNLSSTWLSILRLRIY